MEEWRYAILAAAEDEALSFMSPADAAKLREFKEHNHFEGWDFSEVPYALEPIFQQFCTIRQSLLAGRDC